jgi:23S rRNA pseudouridine2605 synthase
LGALGLDVTRLIRVSYGPFQLGELAEGDVRELRGRALREQLGERLIEEAGANFDAPVATPFSRKQPEAQAEKQETTRSPRPARGPRIEEGGLIRNRKREREQKRENALGRLTTRGPRPERAEKRDESASRRRSANVWMAPGARPGRAKANEDRTTGEATRSKDSPAGKSRLPRRSERQAGSGEGRAGKPRGEKPFREKREGSHAEARGSQPARSGKPKSRFDSGPAGHKTLRTDDKERHGKTPNDKPTKGKRPPTRNAERAPSDTPRDDRRKGKPGADRRR